MMSTAEQRDVTGETAVLEERGTEACCFGDPTAMQGHCKLAEAIHTSGRRTLAVTMRLIMSTCVSHLDDGETVSIEPNEVFVRMPDNTRPATASKRTHEATKVLTQFEGFATEGASHTRRYVFEPKDFSASCTSLRGDIPETAPRVPQDRSKPRKRAELPTSYKEYEDNLELRQQFTNVLNRDCDTEEFVRGCLEILADEEAVSGDVRTYVAGKRAIRQVIQKNGYARDPELTLRVDLLSKALTAAFYKRSQEPHFGSHVDTSWMKHAACRGLASQVFHPEDGVGVSAASEVCKQCPVREDCLDYAIALHIDHGVWGGTSERERRRIAKRRRQEARRAAAN